MVRDDVARILKIIYAAYPNTKHNDDVIEVWYLMLKDYRYEEVAIALRAYISADKKGFAPTIGQLMDRMQLLYQQEELNELEAWSMVTKAVRNSNYNAIEEFSKLPRLVQKAVGDYAQLQQWGILDSTQFQTIVQSNFIKNYRTILQRNKDVKAMPPEVRKLIDKTNANSYSAMLEIRNQMALPDQEEPKVEYDNQGYVPQEFIDKINELKARVSGK